MGKRQLCAVGMLAALVAGCGDSDNGGGTPTGPGGGGGTGTVAATITISAAGAVTPNDVTVPAGSRVTFMNNHNQPHNMASDPHPEHSLCPELNAVGILQPGESRTTGNLNTPRNCTYHDHDQAANPALRGVIRIQ